MFPVSLCRGLDDVFSSVDYYRDSVAMRLSSGRRSRICARKTYLVRVGALLFPSTSSLLVVHHRERCRTRSKKVRIVMSSSQICYDGPKLRPLETRVWQLSSLTRMRTGLAVHHSTYLRVYPLSQHAPFPFEFPHQVGWASLRSLCSQPHLPVGEILHAPKRRTRAALLLCCGSFAY